MTEQQIGQVTMEIAMLGRRGLDINDSTQKYSLQSLAGQRSGLHLLCLMHVGMKRLGLPGADGADLDREFKQTQQLCTD